MALEIKQRGNALGYKILLSIYSIFGYKVVAFFLNFVALYYLFFTPSVKRSMKSYYSKHGIPFSNKVYFTHIKSFAISILDRFISRIKPQDIIFHTHNEDVIQELQDGGIILFSHVGGWASAAYCLQDQLPPMNIIMRESTQKKVQDMEQNYKRYNEGLVKIINLNDGALAANIQIANALINQELIALMVDRVVNENQVVEVSFFNTCVRMNKNSFDIALRAKKPLVAIFVMKIDHQEYDLTFNKIHSNTIQEMAQEYANLLEMILKRYPYQWYNFYDYFHTDTSKIIR